MNSSPVHPPMLARTGRACPGFAFMATEAPLPKSQKSSNEKTKIKVTRGIITSGKIAQTGSGIVVILFYSWMGEGVIAGMCCGLVVRSRK